MARSSQNWCKHYRGMSDKTECEAGVKFATLPHYGTGEFFPTCPCFGPRGGCDRAVYPTAEDLVAAEKESERQWAAIAKAREAIVAHLGGPWKKGVRHGYGQIDCPVCGKSSALTFSRSGYNGHIHAQCSTEDCVAWLE